MKKVKTYKRELGVILLTFWGYVVLNLDTETVLAITPWVFMYVLGAFGLDSYAKQISANGNGVRVSNENRIEGGGES